MFNPHRPIKFEMSTITCNEVMKGNVKCKNSGFEPSFGDLGADAWIRHCNATTRQQISVYRYSKLTFACLYPHIWKSEGTKKFISLAPLANHVLSPPTFRIAAPPLAPMSAASQHLRCQQLQLANANKAHRCVTWLQIIAK